MQLWFREIKVLTLSGYNKMFYFKWREWEKKIEKTKCCATLKIGKFYVCWVSAFVKCIELKKGMNFKMKYKANENTGISFVVWCIFDHFIVNSPLYSSNV